MWNLQHDVVIEGIAYHNSGNHSYRFELSFITGEGPWAHTANFFWKLRIENDARASTLKLKFKVAPLPVGCYLSTTQQRPQARHFQPSLLYRNLHGNFARWSTQHWVSVKFNLNTPSRDEFQFNTTSLLLSGKVMEVYRDRIRTI